MSINSQTPQADVVSAEELADNILKASGSALRHYSLAKSRQEIICAAQNAIDSIRQSERAKRDAAWIKIIRDAIAKSQTSEGV